FNYLVPIGATSLELAAEAEDNLGQKTTVTQSVPVSPDPPPTIVLTAPAPDAAPMEDTSLVLSATASDNVHVTQVRFAVNGVDVATVAPPSCTVSSRVEVRLFNVDDVATVFVNGVQVRSAGYHQDTGFVDVSCSLHGGPNALRFTLSNAGNGWTYGFQV